MSALSFGKIDKHEYLTGEELFSSYRRQIIEQGKLAYSAIGKAL